MKTNHSFFNLRIKHTHAKWLGVLMLGVVTFNYPILGQTAVELEQQTIERALNDLRQGTIEEQVGALMLLGKYQNADARNALFSALSEKSPRLRRAAIVSLLEQNTSYFPGDLAVKLMSMLGDEDAEIRRQISSQLPRIAMSWQMAAGMYPRQQAGAGMGTASLLENAFRDPDALVRRNMVENHQFLSQQAVTSPLLIERLKDDDAQVRRLALRQAGSIASITQLLEAAQLRTVGEDFLWDRELARQLMNHVARPEVVDLLRDLAKSGDSLTSTEAELSLIAAYPQRILETKGFQLLLSQDVPRDSLQRVLRLFWGMDRQVVHNALEQMLQASFASVRLEALRTFPSMSLELSNNELILKLLDDSSSDVRQFMAQLMRAKVASIDPSLLQLMARSRSRDVRELCLSLLHQRDNSTIRPVLMLLLLDEVIPVRQQVLMLIAQRQVDGWDRILQLSLRDDNPIISNTAMTLLRRFNPEAVPQPPTQ